MILGKGSEIDLALGGLGIDVEGVADDDGAEVEGAGHRRGDHGHADIGAPL